LACLATRWLVMGRIFPSGAMAAGDLASRASGFGHRLWDLLVFPVKAPTAFVPIGIVVAALAIAWLVTAVGLVRMNRGRLLRASSVLVGAVLACEAPVSSMPVAPHLDNVRFLSLAALWVLLWLSFAGRAALVAFSLAFLLIQPGNLTAHAEALAIHREVQAQLAHEVATHDDLILAIDLPANHVGVKTFFGSAATLPAVIAPQEPMRVITLLDMRDHPEAIALADQILRGHFAGAAHVRRPFRRLQYDPERRRLVLRDRVVLQMGESLVPGSKHPVPPFGRDGR
jgi:hypothetical protein